LTIDTTYGSDKELAIEFFVVFSRFEFSLKYSKQMYRKPGTRLKKVDQKKMYSVQPNWEMFVSEIRPRLDQIKLTEILNAADGLLNPPVNKEEMDDEKEIVWVPAEKGNRGDLEYIFDLIQIVRNNMFHGGKYLSTDLIMNKQRIKSALNVLRICLNLDEDVKNAHNEIY
jgi:hypothetical protein